jgi:hypothetical protein
LGKKAVDVKNHWRARVEDNDEIRIFSRATAGDRLQPKKSR